MVLLHRRGDRRADHGVTGDLEHEQRPFADQLLGQREGVIEDLLSGVEVACGVGWHGGTPFVIAADFPRHRVTLVPPPDLEAVVAETIRSRDLIRYETRRDELGFCVIARQRAR